EEIQNRQPPHDTARQRLGDVSFRRAVAWRTLGDEVRVEPVALRRGQPRRVSRLVDENNPDDDAEDQRWNAFDDKQPLPSGPPAASVETEKPSAERPTDRSSQRNADHERRHRFTALSLRKPLAEVKDDTWKRACL